MSRLEQIDQAIRVFFLDTGVFPASLEQLEGDYLRSGDLLDPWGRAYGFASDAEGYWIYGIDAQGEPSTEISVVHRFTGAQRLVIEGFHTPTP
jgi:hypothetical protein